MHTIGDSLILAINAGSSSIKFCVYQAGAGLDCVIDGSIDARAGQHATFTVRAGELAAKAKQVPGGSLQSAVWHLASWLGQHLAPGSLRAVVHRIVAPPHGDAAATVVDSALLQQLRAASESAVEHLPLQVSLIEQLQGRYPAAAHLACFDSRFHAAMPRVATLLPLPRRFHAIGIRRHGYHGISCDYIVRALAEVAGPDAAHGRLVIAHLGSGASITAVHRGQSCDTTMGCTPAGGIMMARRPGDLDPGLAWELARHEPMPASAFHQMVNHECGLLGVSGSSADMRVLLRSQATDSDAADAVDLFCYQARKAICAMAGALDGIDTLVFTGGIGEHAGEVRARICAGLSHLGASLDNAQNSAHAAVISAPDSRVCVRVIATDEQLMLARYARAHLAAPATPPGEQCHE